MCNDLIRFADWSKNKSNPEVLDISHWEKLLQSNALFARKFSQKKDAAVVKKVFDTWV